MSEIAISIHSLGKMYKLYHHPKDKVLDAFGINHWLFWRKKYYQEYWALRDLNLEVKKGERLGIVGRNGAGKSTLLKIVSGIITPTEGYSQVNGRVQALMELGTGFHPEFTGRENIRAALSYQGLSSAKIREKEEEIIDFAELGEFIDQPLKTYSAGMSARLSFSTATSFDPEILIIDEILGAGDAYFAGKSLGRMRRLTEDSGATVLFVSHDLGSTQQLCTRVIWIDKGRIIADGTPLEVTKAYYASILQQEEQRLKRQQAHQTQLRLGGDAGQFMHELLGRLVIPGENVPQLAHPIRRLVITDKEGFHLDLEPGAPMDNDITQSAYLLTDQYFMNWSEPRQLANTRIRFFENVGGQYRHAPFVFKIPKDIWDNKPLTLEVEHGVQPGEQVSVEIFDGQLYYSLGYLKNPAKEWHSEFFTIVNSYRVISDDSGANQIETNTIELTAVQDSWATKNAQFTEIVPVDDSGKKKFVFERGETFGFIISATIATILDTCWLVAVIYDAKGNLIYHYHHQFEKAITPGYFTWNIVTHNPNLRQGEYVASFELIPFYDSMATEKLPFYCHWNRRVIFRIDERYVGHIPLGIVDLNFIVK